MSPRGKPPVVHCCVCGKCHSTASTGVLYRSLDGRWQCRNELACLRRQAAVVAAMRRALDEVWAELAADGWRWPA